MNDQLSVTLQNVVILCPFVCASLRLSSVIPHGNTPPSFADCESSLLDHRPVLDGHEEAGCG